MRRPLIGITVDHPAAAERYESPMGYARGVAMAGGLPVLLPYANAVDAAEYVDRLDGIVLSGGNDPDPVLWGQTRHPKTVPIDPPRVRFELALLDAIHATRLPTLGICLGMQMMNIHRGGSLHQFLPDVPRTPMLEHRRLGTQLFRHDVSIEPASLLAETFKKTATNTNTFHKQSIHRLGRGLHAVATAPDGVIEAIEDPQMPLFLGVQWHPEKMLEEPDGRALFDLLIRVASRGQRPKVPPTIAVGPER